MSQSEQKIHSHTLFDSTNLIKNLFNAKPMQLAQSLVHNGANEVKGFEKVQSIQKMQVSPEIEVKMEQSTPTFKKIEENFTLKNQITDSLQNVLNQITSLMVSVQDTENKMLFTRWVDDKGIANLISRCVNDDKQAWRQVVTAKERRVKNKEKLKMKIEQEITYGYRAKGNKQNSKPFSWKTQIKEQENNQVKKEEIQRDPEVVKVQGKSGIRERRYQRGPYKNYPKEIKEHVVQLYKNKNISLNRLSKEYTIPIKNIKRWAENGVDRKQGAGRKKIDPEMEERVFEKIVKNVKIGQILMMNTIRQWALEECKSKDFKASKGWTNKFVEDHGLSFRYTII